MANDLYAYLEVNVLFGTLRIQTLKVLMKLKNLEKSDMSILGVILAGGQAQRMGGIDKGRLKIGDASILEIITKSLSFQLDKIVLNANGNLGRFSDLEIQVIPDTIKGYVGPLAGILSGMRFAEKNGFTSILTVAELK